MAYFQENVTEETKRQKPIMTADDDSQNREESFYIESDYDDGFDDPDEQIPEEISEEEQKAIRIRRFRTASGAWNVVAVIAGTLAILLLLAFLLKMVGFILNDADRTFTLLQTRF